MSHPFRIFKLGCRMALLCFCLSGLGETLSIVEGPEKLPRNRPYGDYSPPLQFQYSGLKTGWKYALKVWLLAPGSWGCASTQWCLREIPVENVGGTNAQGTLVIAENMDVFDYPTFDWILRLYDSAGTEVAFTERYADSTSNLPPVLKAIGNQSGVVGQTLRFTVSASDPEHGKVKLGVDNLPPGAVFDAVSGQFSWVPASSGIYKALFYAQDDGDGQLKDAEWVAFYISGTDLLRIVTQPRSKIIALGDPVQFSVIAEGGEPIGYQWQHQGANILGATSPSLVINPVRTKDQGEYRVMVSNPVGLTNSMPAYLAVTNRAPAIELTAVPAFGTFDGLQGRVRYVDPEFYRVSVFIFLPSVGWLSKPACAQTLTPIDSAGNWTTDITTGGGDEQATLIRALLVRQTSDFHCVTGLECLPPGIETQAVAAVDAIRQNPNQRMLRFSGYDWAVKTGPAPMGPGPNIFSDQSSNVWVDTLGKLHLRITNRDGQWQCAEIIGQKSLGYGTYVFEIESTLDWSENAVLGLFTWTDECVIGSHNEIDLEFSRWGLPNDSNNAQYVVQPYAESGHLLRFQAAAIPSSHSFRWDADRVSFLSLQGAYSSNPPATQVINQWVFSEPAAVPKPSSETPRMNLWLFNGKAPSDDKEVEVVISRFRFLPAALPTLSVSRDGQDILLSWPASFAGFTLEQVEHLPGEWSKVETTSQTAGDSVKVVLPQTGSPRYFRLSN